MRLAEMEASLGSALPPSSGQNLGWWSDDPIVTVMTKAWLAAGHTTCTAHLAGEQMVFAKSTAVPDPAPATGFSEGGGRAGTLQVERVCDLTVPLYGDAGGPADRILIATAREYKPRVVTRDRKILDYAEKGHVMAMKC